MRNRLKGKTYSYLWHMPLACFILAALTGFLYRLGLLGWLPGNLRLQNIRHAHSHLMFFGWAVPFPMVILLNKIKEGRGQKTAGIRWMIYGIMGTLFFGLLAYPFFLIYGYQPVEMGPAALPLSAFFSSLVMISWYGYMWGYLKSRNYLEGNSRLWFDGAFLLLFICSLGAWGTGATQALMPSNYLLIRGITHFFLAAFTEGWIVLVLLAVLISSLKLQTKYWLLPPNISLVLIGSGALLTFPFGISEFLLSPLLVVMARVGGLFSAVGLLIVLLTIGRSNRWQKSIWIWPIALLLLKALMQLSASVAPALVWLSDHGLRILYLHVLLLGAFTITMMGVINIKGDVAKRYFKAIAWSIILTLLSLVLPTGLWPTDWGGRWVFKVLAGAALLPVITIFVQWIGIRTLQTYRT